MDTRMTSLLICSLALMATHLTILASNEVQLIKSPVYFRPVVGDPLRIDALSALIATAGGDMREWEWRNPGHHNFPKSLGPFVSMDVFVFENRVAWCDSHFTHGGQVSRVVSKAHRKDLVFDDGVATLRRVGNDITREMRNVTLSESNVVGSCYVLHTEKPTYWGWRIKMSVSKRNDESLDFELELMRDLRPTTNVVGAVEVDVEI